MGSTRANTASPPTASACCGGDRSSNSRPAEGGAGGAKVRQNRWQGEVGGYEQVLVQSAGPAEMGRRHSSCRRLGPLPLAPTRERGAVAVCAAVAAAVAIAAAAHLAGLQQADLAGHRFCCGFVVPGDHDHSDARSPAQLNRVAHLGARRVLQAGGQAASREGQRRAAGGLKAGMAARAGISRRPSQPGETETAAAGAERGWKASARGGGSRCLTCMPTRPMKVSACSSSGRTSERSDAGQGR